MANPRPWKLPAVWRLYLILFVTTSASASVRGGVHTVGDAPRPAFRNSGLSLRAQSRWQQWLQGQALPSHPVAAETLRVLALRVSFVPDQSDSTTGDGTFDLSPPSDPTIDPAPHDRGYFEHQLQALSNFYRKVSNGRLIIVGDVFPQDSTASYELSRQMSYYGPEGPDELVDQRLAELFRDALQLADADPAVDFSRYDAVAVFHAGVGRDFGFDFDPTPKDIPSVFLDEETLGRGLGQSTDFSGIPVDDGQVLVREGIILPESQSQEGFEIGLLGTAVLMFGHQIGLPNLFDTESGRPGIGRWGMMDQGSGNFQGLLPAEPSAWSKVFMGWEIPVVVRNAENLVVAAARSDSSGPRIYKVPITRDEYFLIENRERDVNGDGIAVGRDASGSRVEFKRDERGDQILAGAAIGVITQVDEYDYGLPGSGLLIWHIDEAVIRQQYRANRVNADPKHRGVDLEEADGAQDIGQDYGLLDPGAGSENGVSEDAFWGSNKINLLVNDTTVVAFTPTSYPDSRANSGANSHVVVTDISEPGPVMTFTVRMEMAQTGFPQPTVEQLEPRSLTIADLDADGAPEVLLATTGIHFRPSATKPGGIVVRNASKVLAWRADGQKVLANIDPLAVLASLKLLETATTAPVCIDLDGDGALEVSIGTEARGFSVARLVAFAVRDEDRDGRADELWEVPNSAALRSVVALSDGSLAAADESASVFRVTAAGHVLWRRTLAGDNPVGMVPTPGDVLVVAFGDGEVIAVSPEGEILWQKNLGRSVRAAPVTGKLEAAGPEVVVVVAEDGTVFALRQSGDLLVGFPALPPVDGSLAVGAAPALADIDGDGANEILFASNGSIFAVNANGTLVAGFPSRRPASFGPASQSMSAPVVGDVDGDGWPDIVVGSQGGLLLAVDGSGEVIDGFPVAVGSEALTTPALADLDGDGDLELLVAGDDGYLSAYDLAGQADVRPWPMYQHDGRRSGRAPAPSGGTAPGGGLMPVESVYNYPNPTEGDETRIRYRLNAPAEVRVKIFDLAGELVEELAAPGVGGTDNEAVWKLDGVQSGVYLARVEAKGSKATDVAVIKIAVVK